MFRDVCAKINIPRKCETSMLKNLGEYENED
jgi:hypothetical protein